MRINDARRQVLSSGVDDGGAGGRVYGLADGGDLAVLDVDGAILILPWVTVITVAFLMTTSGWAVTADCPNPAADASAIVTVSQTR